MKARFAELLATVAAERIAPWLARMAERPLRHPDGSLELSIKSFEQLKARGDRVTWTLGTRWATGARILPAEIEGPHA